MRLKKKLPPVGPTRKAAKEYLQCHDSTFWRKFQGPMRYKDLAGMRFGRLTVLQRDRCSRWGEVIWKCRCDCGKETAVVGSSLRKGYTQSCGCLRSESVSMAQATHRQTKTKLYNVWTHMIQRCYNPKHVAYKRYGGRGITVCEEWRNSFLIFQKWAMENGYDENAPFHQCTIDRIDNDRGYSPDNCRWADAKTQRNNQSKVVKGVKSDEKN